MFLVTLMIPSMVQVDTAGPVHGVRRWIETCCLPELIVCLDTLQNTPIYFVCLTCAVSCMHKNRSLILDNLRILLMLARHMLNHSVVGT